MSKILLLLACSLLAFGSGKTGGGGGGVGVPVPANLLSLKVSSEVGPPGSIVQVKLLVTNPKPIITGTFAMDFSASFFDDILGISVMSASNDAYGVASYQAGRLSFEIKSATGSIGMIPGGGYPLVVIAARIKPTALVGSSTSVSMNLSQSTINDLFGASYSVEVAPGTITVGGTLSVGDVVPGGGTINAGDTIQVTGVGFDQVSDLRIETTAKYTWQVVNKNLINVRALSPFFLDAQRFVVKNKSGESDTYFSYPRSHFFLGAGASWTSTLKPLLPGLTIKSGLLAYPAGDGAVSIWNPRFVDQTVNFQAFDPSGRNLGSGVLTVAARSTLTNELSAMGLSGVALLKLDTEDGVGLMGIARGVTSTPIIPTITTRGDY